VPEEFLLLSLSLLERARITEGGKRLLPSSFETDFGSGAAPEPTGVVFIVTLFFRFSTSCSSGSDEKLVNRSTNSYPQRSTLTCLFSATQELQVRGLAPLGDSLSKKNTDDAGFVTVYCVDVLRPEKTVPEAACNFCSSNFSLSVANCCFATSI
jgi:hypothetical protein